MQENTVQVIARFFHRYSKTGLTNHIGQISRGQSESKGPMADIVLQHDEGEAYSLVVAVNEQDTRISLSPNESFTALFATENARTYDDDEDE